jgi:hypothetical protein
LGKLMHFFTTFCRRLLQWVAFGLDPKRTIIAQPQALHCRASNKSTYQNSQRTMLQTTIQRFQLYPVPQWRWCNIVDGILGSVDTGSVAANQLYSLDHCRAR